MPATSIGRPAPNPYAKAIEEPRRAGAFSVTRGVDQVGTGLPMTLVVMLDAASGCERTDVSGVVQRDRNRTASRSNWRPIEPAGAAPLAEALPECRLFPVLEEKIGAEASLA
jgi:hypothetical protein